MFIEHVVPDDRKRVDRAFRRAIDTGDGWRQCSHVHFATALNREHVQQHYCGRQHVLRQLIL